MFWPMFPFYTPWKHQNTFGFRMHSGCIKLEDSPEINQLFKRQPHKMVKHT